MRKILFVFFILAAAFPLACGNNNPSSPSGNSNNSGGAANTPTATNTPGSPTSTPTVTLTFTPTATATITLTATHTVTSSVTSTPSATPTVTRTFTNTPTESSTPTPTLTATNTATLTPTSTWTSTPGCIVGGTSYGNANVEPYSLTANSYYYAQSFSPGSSGTVTNAAAYFNATGTASNQFRMALYLQTDSSDGTYLSECDITSYVSGVNTVTMEPAVPVTAGTNYWIVLETNGPDLAYTDLAPSYDTYGFLAVTAPGFVFPSTIGFSTASGSFFTFYALVCPCVCP